MAAAFGAAGGGRAAALPRPRAGGGVLHPPLRRRLHLRGARLRRPPERGLPPGRPAEHRAGVLVRVAGHLHRGAGHGADARRLPLAGICRHPLRHGGDAPVLLRQAASHPGAPVDGGEPVVLAAPVGWAGLSHCPVYARPGPEPVLVERRGAVHPVLRSDGAAAGPAGQPGPGQSAPPPEHPARRVRPAGGGGERGQLRHRPAHRSAAGALLAGGAHLGPAPVAGSHPGAGGVRGGLRPVPGRPGGTGCGRAPGRASPRWRRSSAAWSRGGTTCPA